MTLRIFRVLAACALFAAGCSDEPASNQQAEHQSSEMHSGLTGNGNPPKWIDATSRVDPVAWLIEREKSLGRDLSADDADQLRQSLAKAAERFKEDPRMIANRAVQLETMLNPEDASESAAQLVGRITDVVHETGRAEGFGALGQQYYNLRKAGLSGQEAIDDLTRRYGSPG
jgi:hypothetical protein